MEDLLLSPAETLGTAISKLTDLLDRATPADPAWFVKENDLVGGTCIMSVDSTPGDASNAGDRRFPVADFMNQEDAELVVALRNAAPALLALMTMVLNTHTDVIPLPFDDGSASAWPVPVGVLHVADALFD